MTRHLTPLAIPVLLIVLELVALYMLIQPLDPSYGLFDPWKGTR